MRVEKKQITGTILEPEVGEFQVFDCKYGRFDVRDDTLHSRLKPYQVERYETLTDCGEATFTVYTTEDHLFATHGISTHVESNELVVIDEETVVYVGVGKEFNPSVVGVEPDEADGAMEVYDNVIHPYRQIHNPKPTLVQWDVMKTVYEESKVERVREI